MEEQMQTGYKRNTKDTMPKLLVFLNKLNPSLTMQILVTLITVLEH